MGSLQSNAGIDGETRVGCEDVIDVDAVCGGVKKFSGFGINNRNLMWKILRNMRKI